MAKLIELLNFSFLTCFQVVETCDGKKIGQTQYVIQLIDDNGEVSIDLAQELIKHGHAKPSRSLAQVTYLSS